MVFKCDIAVMRAQNSSNNIIFNQNENESNDFFLHFDYITFIYFLYNKAIYALE